MSELVSVVIPTYGGGKTLTRSINSVLTQTYKNIEIIVVDDNGLGTEHQINTHKKIEHFIEKKQIKYICHKKNINGAAARNTGVKNSRGIYIALLDDDDIYYPDHIQTEVKILESLPDDYALVYCSNDRYINGKKDKEFHVNQSGYLLYECLMHKVTPTTSGLLIRKSVWNELGGFDESFKRFQDFEFTVRVCAKYKIQASNHIGFSYNSTNQNSVKTPEAFRQLKIHYLDKMMPYIEMLPKWQQKNVITNDRIEIAIQFLKKRQFDEFWNEFKATKSYVRGLLILCFRFLNTLFN